MATTPEWLLKLLRGINTKDISVPENYEANRTDPTTYSAVEPSLVDAGLDAPDPGEIMPPEGESLPELPRTGIFNTNALPTDVDEQDALDAMVLADRVRSLESSKEKVAGFTKPEEQTPEEKSYGAKAAGVVAGIGPAGAILANPALAYPAYIAGKSAIDIKDAVQNPESTLAKGLKNELKGADNLTKFPETASAAGEIVGGNVVPEAGVNLLGTLTKALTGGIKGLSGGAQKVLSTTDAALNDTRSALAPIANSTTAKLLGAIAGASDKADAASVISSLALGKDVTKPNITQTMAGDAYLTALDQQANTIINTPIAGRTAEQVKFLESYPENRKSYIASLAEKTKKESDEFEKMKKEAEAKLKQGELDQKNAGAFGVLREGTEYTELAKKAAVRTEMSNLIGQQLNYYGQLQRAANAGDRKGFESAMEKLKSLQGQTSAYISMATGQGAMSQSDKENLDRQNSVIMEATNEAEGANLAMVGVSSSKGYPIYLKLRGKLNDAIQGQLNFLKASKEPFMVASDKYSPTEDNFNKFSGESRVIKNIPNLYGSDLAGDVEQMALSIESEQTGKAGARTQEAKEQYMGKPNPPFEVDASPEFAKYGFDEMLQLREEAKAKGDTALENRVKAALKMGAYNRSK